AATVVPLWSAAHLPFTALPQHVSAIATLRHWWDPAWKSQEYFTLELGQTQYLLYYLAGAALTFPFGTAERANLVLLSAIAVAYPFSLRSLLRALRADTRLALFGCTLFWSQALLIGFFNYVAAMPLTIWALALALRQTELPSRRTLWALLAAIALLAWPQRREPEEHPWRRGLVAVWLAWAAFLYLAFPVSIGWMWQLSERYALLFALLLPALLRPARGLRGALPLLLAVATGFFAAGTALANIRAFAREVGPFDEVLARAQPGRRLIGMIFEQNSRYAKFSAFLHFQAYYRARMGGVASFSFAELPQSPLRYRPENAPPPHPAGWEWHANAFRNDVDGYYYDYVLVGGLVDPFARPQPGPRWRLMA